jgi:hypothetical protein
MKTEINQIVTVARLIAGSITAAAIVAGCLVAATCLSGCKRDEKPVTAEEFGKYISGFSAEIEPQQSIMVVLRIDPESAPQCDEKQLFSLSPDVKGRTFDTREGCVFFHPDKPLKCGQTYEVAFKLGKMINGVDKRHRTFRFKVRVKEQHCKMNIASVAVKEGNTVDVSGSLEFSIPVKNDDVKASLSSNPNISPTITKIDSLHYDFAFNQIARKEKDYDLKIKLERSKATYLNEDMEQSIVIPAQSEIRLLDVKAVSEPETCIEIVFTQKLDERQDIEGLITVAGVEKPKFVIDGNLVRLYYDELIAATEVAVYKGIKSADGHKTDENVTRSLVFEPLKPQFKILSSGVIIPDADNLHLHFRAVNLKALDVRVIQVYENNIMSFLYENNLYGKRNLNRYARIVHYETLELKQKNNAWNNYTLDLARIFRRQKGAIYRLIFTFYKEYTTWQCNSGETKIEYGKHAITERDAHYYTDDYYLDYSGGYDWRQRENPCHTMYYTTEVAYSVINVMNTNIGVIAKGVSDDNRLWVSTSNILTGKPLGNAQVTAYNIQRQVIGSCVTDEEGFAILQTKGEARVLTVTDGVKTSEFRFVQFR